MNCLILLSQHSPSGEGLANNLNGLHVGNTYVARRYDELMVVIKNNIVQIDFLADGGHLTDFDLVYLRGMENAPLRHALAVYLWAQKIAVVNSESFNFQTMTKLEQNVVMALEGVPVADSLYVSSRKNYLAAIEKAGFDFPLVVKAIDGKNGNHNVKVGSAVDIDNLGFDDAIIQPYLPNDFDYRTIVAGEKVIVSYKRIRQSEESHLNNIARGGHSEFVDLPKELEPIAIAAARAVGREFTGLDILTNKSTGKSVVLEVNFNFGEPLFPNVNDRKSYHQKVDNYFQSLAQGENDGRNIKVN
ncbi:MAG: hypothetical protein LBQ02_02480 [Candidatus Nomurabacteria bacterium]|jgi:glutathione synthase/RimK-type ligase-like ATP-grasp enzyme|nr:hypothetical protein [Candidatus Nomurabacteria bacterium]